MDRNPQSSVRKLAEVADISRSSMQRVFVDDLQLRPYKNSHDSWFQNSWNRNLWTGASRCYGKWSEPPARSSFGWMRSGSRWRLWPLRKIIEFMHLALETHWSTSEVNVDARNVFALWSGVLLPQMRENLLWHSSIKEWTSMAKFI